MNDSSQESPTHIFAPDSINAWPKPADTYFWSRWKNRVSAFAIGLLQPGTFWVLAYSFLALPCLVSANGGIFAIETDTEVSQGAESLLDLNCNEFLVDGTFRLGSGRVDNASEVIISSGGTIDGGSGILNVKGNWTDFGDFIASTGRVRLLAACTGTPVQVTGVTTFCHLDLSTTGIDYLFPADQTITILCSLNLGQGNRLIAVGGGNAFFQLGPAAVITGTADLDRVVIRQPDSPSPVPIPAIGPAGLVTLALLLGGVATWRKYPRSGAAALTDRPKTA